MDKMHWGMLGTGMVAGWLRKGFRGCQKAELRAVASRTLAKATAFAQEHEVPTAYGTYEELLADASIDAVVIALPNSLHREWVEKSARAGKHVLCEKPLALRGVDVEAMSAVARQHGVRLMEAAMYRFQPQIAGLLGLLAENRIGTVRLVQAAFCFPFKDRSNIRLNRDLGGGCLFDLGFYPVSLACLVAGRVPDSVSAAALWGDSQVEEMLAGVLDFGHGLAAVIECAFRTDIKIHAEITGEGGRVILPDPWTARGARKAVQIVKAKKVEESMEFDDPNAYGLEIDHYSEAIWTGGPLLWSEADSFRTIRTLEALQASARSGCSVRLGA